MAECTDRQGAPQQRELAERVLRLFHTAPQELTREAEKQQRQLEQQGCT